MGIDPSSYGLKYVLMEERGRKGINAVIEIKSEGTPECTDAHARTQRTHAHRAEQAAKMVREDNRATGDGERRLDEAESQK